ncbi:Murein L,D-transpeptidase YcbB/YkuD [Roseovarius azorensis]|uniref:Murein L,D-transpeptidase YcbB/YkuD n=1 Tax=Roseovarius azorensis TaxID=1287727 RepID=A0A1H7VFP5_9RHOB|nr:L,D-transpeptidase family protein [Roseovarius azorensis]SEM07597.1 Murein L,D-transpeptidase YcbB/YkuD [Roseovarius azorensis]
MKPAISRREFGPLLAGAALFVTGVLGAAPAAAQSTAFRQAVAEAAASDRDIAEFYRANGYRAIWTGEGAGDAARRQALIRALSQADAHGLPVARYDLGGLMARMGDARSMRDLGLIEVELSRTYLQYARDLQSGILIPSQIDEGIKREVSYRDRTAYLIDMKEKSPRDVLRALPPQSQEYARLMKEKLHLEHLIAQGGWGPAVPADVLKPGQESGAVIALRDRLIAMGYLDRSASRSYDARLQQAVQAFQADHGLEPDGVAGASTLAALNIPASERLKSVIVAMERERWLNGDRGARHILVNLTDFSARILDNDIVTFRTRAVVGMNASGRRSPEFSDAMEYMVINPTWHVPRSIAVQEYLPQMQANPNAVSHLRLYDSRGREVSRGAVNFGAYNARTFPFAIKQPPSNSNALGLVKFMFPNKYNIYLHDTPHKSLFDREKRDFSHGCIRLQQPFEFAYELLSRQESDPMGYFHSVLGTGRETYVNLKAHVPVHIIYRTAFTLAQGRTQYRGDVYGRDARIWEALDKAGVSLTAVQG